MWSGGSAPSAAQRFITRIAPVAIYASLSGFGDVGPYRDRSAYDTVIQAYAGIASSQADPDDGQPVFLQQVVADKVTALYASQAVTVALFARAVGRGGQHLHLSMVDAVVSFSGPTPRAITEAPRVSCTLGVL